MSYLMDYGPDWPPPPRRGRRSLRRWLNAPKRQRRAGFDRWFWINASLMVGVVVVCALVLKATDQRIPQTRVTFATPTPHPTTTARPNPTSSSRPGRNDHPRTATGRPTSNRENGQHSRQTERSHLPRSAQPPQGEEQCPRHLLSVKCGVRMEIFPTVQDLAKPTRDIQERSLLAGLATSRVHPTP